MVMNTTARMSITIKPELKALVQEVAKENSTSASKLVAGCLEELLRNRREKSLIEYYKTEDKKYAAESAKVISKIARSWTD